jgi:hypothetical protein
MMLGFRHNETKTSVAPLARTTWLSILLLCAPISYAQDDNGSPDSENSRATTPHSSAAKSNEDDDNIIRAPKEPEAPPPKEFTKSEIQKVCSKYQGKLISVYGEIYKLQNCTRHLVQDQDELFKFGRQGTKTVEVEATDVAAIPVGEHWEALSSKNRSCSFFNKKYITFSYTDIYYVENCVRKLIPDYETFVIHRKEHAGKQSEVLALTAREFYAIRQGRDITSVVDKEFHKLLEGYAGVDIIPIDEACKGVEGKIVTFYSRMYKIEKCHKREIDAESFTMHRKLNDTKLIELHADQWVSMPDGKPFTDKK